MLHGEAGVFCTKCGKDLFENAYFCPYCGARTNRGADAKVPIPKERYDWEQEIEKALSTATEEVEKALEMATAEIEKALKMTRKETRKAASSVEPAICSNCGERNPVNARFCRKCGKKL